MVTSFAETATGASGDTTALGADLPLARLADQSEPVVVRRGTLASSRLVYGCSGRRKAGGWAPTPRPGPAASRSPRRPCARRHRGRGSPAGGQAEFVAQGGDQVQDAALGDDVETGRRLVEDEDLGRAAMAMAMATRCCWPPDSSCG